MSNAHYFVGIPVPSKYHAYFINLQQTLELEHYYRRVTHATDLHCTLSFIGELSSDQLQQLQQLLSELKSKPFSMSTTEIAGFGEGKIPRVVYTAVEGNQALDELEQKVWAVTSRFGADRKSPYVPHVTLAKRTRQIEDIRFTGQAQVSWEVAEFCLFRVNKGMRPSYEQIASFPLQLELFQ
ncbi:RNA 2',3'-cyclic phosphodiesterase [Chryseomicrobium imtechense]